MIHGIVMVVKYYIGTETEINRKFLKYHPKILHLKVVEWKNFAERTQTIIFRSMTANFSGFTIPCLAQKI